MTTHDDLVKLFDAQREAWKARDPDALARGYTPDATIISPIFRTVEGRDAIVRSFHMLFQMFPDWDYVAQDLIVDGETVAEHFIVHATHTREFMGLPGSGRKFDIQGMRLFKMRDGLIAHERRYYDFTGLLMHLDILRGKPAKP